jgi:hypothetical protein
MGCSRKTSMKVPRFVLLCGALALSVLNPVRAEILESEFFIGTDSRTPSGESMLKGQSLVGFMRLSLSSGWSAVVNPFSSASNRIGDVLVAEDGLVVMKPATGGFGVAAAAGGWSDTNLVLEPSGAFLIYNPATNARTVTLVGTVLGTNQTNLRPGLTLAGAPSATVAGGISSTLGYPALVGDTVWRLIGSGSFQSATFTNGAWRAFEPILSVGEGFWIRTTTNRTWNLALTDLEGSNTNNPVALAATQPYFPVATVSGTSTNQGRVFRSDTSAPLDDAFVGQLWAGVSANAAGFQAASALLPFRSGWLTGSSVATVPSGTAGSNAFVQLRVWSAANPTGAPLGSSDVISVRLGETVNAAGGPGALPGLPNTFANFAVAPGNTNVAGPSLTLVVGSPNLVLNATGSTAGFVIQSKTNLASPAWQTLTNTFTGSTATIPASSGPPTFFRLARP